MMEKLLGFADHVEASTSLATQSYEISASTEMSGVITKGHSSILQSMSLVYRSLATPSTVKAPTLCKMVSKSHIAHVSDVSSRR